MLADREVLEKAEIELEEAGAGEKIPRPSRSRPLRASVNSARSSAEKNSTPRSVSCTLPIGPERRCTRRDWSRHSRCRRDARAVVIEREGVEAREHGERKAARHVEDAVHLPTAEDRGRAAWARRAGSAVPCRRAGPRSRGRARCASRRNPRGLCRARDAWDRTGRSGRCRRRSYRWRCRRSPSSNCSSRRIAGCCVTRPWTWSWSELYQSWSRCSRRRRA